MGDQRFFLPPKAHNVGKSNSVITSNSAQKRRTPNKSKMLLEYGERPKSTVKHGKKRSGRIHSSGSRATEKATDHDINNLDGVSRPEPRGLLAIQACKSLDMEPERNLQTQHSTIERLIDHKVEFFSCSEARPDEKKLDLCSPL